MEVCFDKPDLPRLPGLPVTLQVLVAVDPHHIEEPAVLLQPPLAEPRLEDRVVTCEAVRVIAAGATAPDDERGPAVGKVALDRTELPGAVEIERNAANHAEAPVPVGLDIRTVALGGVHPPDAQPEEPVERLDQIYGRSVALVGAGATDPELVAVWIEEGAYIQQRATAASLDIEEVTKGIPLPEANGIRKLAVRRRAREVATLCSIPRISPCGCAALCG